jgi:hypothetical protein
LKVASLVWFKVGWLVIILFFLVQSDMVW